MVKKSSALLGIAISLFIILNIFLANSHSSTSYAERLREGLVGYWSMDEGTGNILVENIYGINNASIQGNVTYVEGVDGFATGNYTQVGDIANLSNSTAYSFETYSNLSIAFKANTSWQHGGSVLIQKGDTLNKGWNIQESTAGIIQVNLLDTWASNYIRVQYGGLTLHDGRFHSYLVTYNGTANYTGINFYFDGVQQASTSFHDGVISDISNQDVMTFGGCKWGENYSYQINGTIDDISIRNITLNADDAIALNNSMFLKAYQSPNVSNNYPASNNVNSNNVGFNISAVGVNITKFSLFINGQENITTYPNATTAYINESVLLKEGSYNWTSYAEDNNSHFSFGYPNNTLLVDVTNTNITINSPLGTTTSATITINITPTDSVGISSCRYNITRGASTEKANAFFPANYSDVYTLSGVGTYVIWALCNDTSGNNKGVNWSIEYALGGGGGDGGGGGSGNLIEKIIEEVSVEPAIKCEPFDKKVEEILESFSWESANWTEIIRNLWDSIICRSVSSIVEFNVEGFT